MNVLLLPLITLMLFLTMITPTNAYILNVPADYETIQDAIGWSADGDTILVQPGEYTENIDFDGKNIAVIGNPDDPSKVVIDGGGENRVVTFDQGESSDALLSGFTIMNGREDWNGGGIFCEDSSPTLQYLIISGNSAYEGGGIFCRNSLSTLQNLIIRENEATSDGGGLYCSGNQSFILRDIVFEENSARQGGGLNSGVTELELWDITITGNYASSLGAGVYISRGDRVEMTNVLIARNVADEVGGVAMDGVSEVFLTNVTIAANSGAGWVQHTLSNDIRTNMLNSIVWGNNGDQIYLYSGHGDRGENRFDIAYTDLHFGSMGISTFGELCVVNIGEGMLEDDPLFVDPDEGDYHLTADSPCIDAGDPESPEDPDETRVDMGAFFYNQGNAVNENEMTPSEFGISNIFPNPFNSAVTVSYNLPVNSDASLQLFDITGREVTTLLNGSQIAGSHAMEIDNSGLSAGIYLIRLKSRNDVSVRKVVLVK
ncbi:T9SS type A sorting domain-containing protein [bacterium]|nr:T9SS type A sorting domain-containing protein [bacterium]